MEGKGNCCRIQNVGEITKGFHLSLILFELFSLLVISPDFVGFFLHYLFIIHYYTIHCKICIIKEHESFGECNWTEDVG